MPGGIDSPGTWHPVRGRATTNNGNAPDSEMLSEPVWHAGIVDLPGVHSIFPFVPIVLFSVKELKSVTFVFYDTVSLASIFVPVVVLFPVTLPLVSRVYRHQQHLALQDGSSNRQPTVAVKIARLGLLQD